MEKKIADLTVNEFQLLINQAVHNAFEEISEDIPALLSSVYLESIEAARQDFKKGRTGSFEEVFCQGRGAVPAPAKVEQ